MKKTVSAIIVLALACAVLASCASGVSVPYYILAMDNYTVNIFDTFDAYKETVTYYEKGEKTFEYSIYLDIGEGGIYNLCESYDGYSFYCYKEDFYAVTGGKTYAVIKADNSTYFDFIKDYEERAHSLDEGSKFQKYSKKVDGDTEVCYYAKVTPLMAAELAGFGVTETDKIVSKYLLKENTDHYLSIEYSIEHADGTTEKIAERKFEYYDSAKTEIFADLPEKGETVNVTIIYENGREDVYKLPKGVYIGIDSGEKNVSYYTDASFENAFNYEDAQALEHVKIYAKNN